MNELTLSPERAILYEQLITLRKEYAAVYTQHDSMISQERDTIYIVYLNTIGKDLYENYCLSVEIGSLKLMVEAAQAALNRNEVPNMIEIELIVKQQMDKYYKQMQQQADELEQAQKATFVDEDKTKELKDTYRLLVKRLHPDLHPNQPDYLNDLFLQIQTAYHTQNLEVLQSVLLRLNMEQMDKGDELFTTDTITTHIESLKSQIEKLKKKIIDLEKSFPFCYRNLLTDEEWVKMELNRLKEERIHLEKEKHIYTERLNLLKEL